MSRNLVRLASTGIVALLLGLGASLAHAAVATLDDLANAQLVPSTQPALLGPINELGRNGWQCLPEKAAQSTAAMKADLPSS